MRNPYQERLAEHSLVSTPAGNGEYWDFTWFIDPITNGLANWLKFTAHVSEDGVSMVGLRVALDEKEIGEQENAIQFIKERYERFGLNEEDM